MRGANQAFFAIVAPRLVRRGEVDDGDSAFIRRNYPGFTMRRLLLTSLCWMPLAIGSVQAEDTREPLSDPFPATVDHATASLHAPLPAPDAGVCDHRPLPHRHAGAVRAKPLQWLTYRQPLLPPPASFYGYFNSPPQHAHLWDTYCPRH